MSKVDLIIDKIKEGYRKKINKIKFGYHTSKEYTLIEIRTDDVEELKKYLDKAREKAENIEQDGEITIPQTRAEFTSMSMKEKGKFLATIYKQDIRKIQIGTDESEGKILLKLYNEEPEKLKNLLLGLHSGMVE